MEEYLKPYGFISAIGMYLWDKGSSKSSLTELVELIVDKSEQDATFPYSWVTYHDNFYLS